MKVDWAINEKDEQTPYEVGKRYPPITITCRSGWVRVLLVTDGFNGIPADGTGVVNADLRQGNSITREARLVSITGIAHFSEGSLEVRE